MTEGGCTRKIHSDRELNPKGTRYSSIINIRPRQGKARGRTVLMESTQDPAPFSLKLYRIGLMWDLIHAADSNRIRDPSFLSCAGW